MWLAISLACKGKALNGLNAKYVICTKINTNKGVDFMKGGWYIKQAVARRQIKKKNRTKKLLTRQTESVTI